MASLGQILEMLMHDHSIHRIPFRRRRNGRTFVSCLYIGPIDYFLRNFSSMENLLCEVHDMHVNKPNVMGIVVTGFYATEPAVENPATADATEREFLPNHVLQNIEVPEYDRNAEYEYPGPMVMSVVRVLRDGRIEVITDEVRELVRKRLSQEAAPKQGDEQEAA